MSYLGAQGRQISRPKKFFKVPPSTSSASLDLQGTVQDREIPLFGIVNCCYRRLLINHLAAARDPEPEHPKRFLICSKPQMFAPCIYILVNYLTTRAIFSDKEIEIDPIVVFTVDLYIRPKRNINKRLMMDMVQARSSPHQEERVEVRNLFFGEESYLMPSFLFLLTLPSAS